MNTALNRREFLKTLSKGTAALAAAPCLSCRSKPKSKPNIILIVADDLGYGDTEAYDGWLETPHVRRMAAQGMKFTDFHSNGAVCTPTRIALLTGRYQQRFDIENVIVGSESHPTHDLGLDPEVLTIPRLMKNAGYRTALFGKWHCGSLKKFNPIHHGFDEFRGYLNGAIDYHYHEKSWYQGLENRDEEGYTTHLINDHAVRFIEENRKGPFCLFVTHEAIHLPFQTPEDPPYSGPDAKPPYEKGKYWEYWTKETIRPKFRGMMRELDNSIKNILDTVESCGIADNTFVFFMSDNGAIHEAGSNKPFRGGKADLWEGGHRVPAIGWWPGRIPAGTVTDVPTAGMDLLPTMCDIAGIRMPSGTAFDGVSFKDVLLKNKKLPPRFLFWGYGTRGTAMRDGKWKFITSPRGWELYDLDADPGEANNLADRFPRKAGEMNRAVADWLADVHSEFPLRVW